MDIRATPPVLPNLSSNWNWWILAVNYVTVCYLSIYFCYNEYAEQGPPSVIAERIEGANEGDRNTNRCSLSLPILYIQCTKVGRRYFCCWQKMHMMAMQTFAYFFFAKKIFSFNLSLFKEFFVSFAYFWCSTYILQFSFFLNFFCLVLLWCVYPNIFLVILLFYSMIILCYFFPFALTLL